MKQLKRKYFFILLFLKKKSPVEEKLIKDGKKY
jgi:hypothetical protein